MVHEKIPDCNTCEFDHLVVLISKSLNSYNHQTPSVKRDPESSLLKFAVTVTKFFKVTPNKMKVKSVENDTQIRHFSFPENKSKNIHHPT